MPKAKRQKVAAHRAAPFWLSASRLFAFQNALSAKGFASLSPCSVGRSLSRQFKAAGKGAAVQGGKQKFFAAALGEKKFCALDGKPTAAYCRMRQRPDGAGEGKRAFSPLLQREGAERKMPLGWILDFSRWKRLSQTAVGVRSGSPPRTRLNCPRKR